MKKVIKYQAYDGTLFDDKKSCLEYESVISDLDECCEDLYLCLDVLEKHLIENSPNDSRYKTLLSAIKTCKYLAKSGRNMDIYTQASLSNVIGFLRCCKVEKNICDFFQKLYNIKSNELCHH